MEGKNDVNVVWGKGRSRFGWCWFWFLVGCHCVSVCGGGA